MAAAKLKIRVYGDPCLRKKSELVQEVGPGERILIAAMIETMYESKGIGLAASQIGINQQIFVADIGDGPLVVINPRIVKKSGMSVMEEGCLSVPGIMLDIKRSQKITVQYKDEYNQPVECEYSELMARVFQHETDHLMGKFIVDYVGKKEKAELKEQLEEIQGASGLAD